MTDESQWKERADSPNQDREFCRSTAKAADYLLCDACALSDRLLAAAGAAFRLDRCAMGNESLSLMRKGLQGRCGIR